MAAPHLVLVTRPELAQTNQLFENACRSEGVAYVPVEAGHVAASALPAERGGRLLYCAAADFESGYLEALLFSPDVAAFHDPRFTCSHPGAALLQARVPIPRTVYLPASDHEILRQQVDWLGGFPVVIKRPGTEGGEGVSRAVDMSDLKHQLTEAPAGSWLEEFVDHGRGLRLLVLGQRVIATTASVAADGDFRSNGPGAADLGEVEPPEGAEQIAVRAARALRLEYAGVDLMETHDGGLLVSEVNCPCYFAHQQEATGRDLAAEMLRYLLAKLR